MWGPRECPCAGLGLGGWSSQGRLPEGAAVQAKTENLMEWEAVEKRMFWMEEPACAKAWRWVEGSCSPLLPASGH